MKADAGVGHTDLLGRVNDGVDIDAELAGGVPAGTPTVELDLHAGVGEILVSHERGQRNTVLEDGCGG